MLNTAFNLLVVVILQVEDVIERESASLDAVLDILQHLVVVALSDHERRVLGGVLLENFFLLCLFSS